MAISAYVLIDVEAGKLRPVLTALKKKKEVQSVHLVTGPHDVIALIEAPDINELSEIVAETIQKVQGVQRTMTCICVEQE